MRAANSRNENGLLIKWIPGAQIWAKALIISTFNRVRSRSPRLRGNLWSGNLKSAYQSRVDQEPVEAAGLCAVLAGIEQALAAQHDLLLLLERRVERNAGSFLDHQRQIGPVDGIHHGRAFDRLEVDGVDRVIGRVVARIVILQLLADTGLVEIRIEQSP